MRKLSPNNTLMYGGNVFYDREFNTDHSRIGFGLELKSSVYDLNFNLYEALSNKETVDGALEEAADGYDLEVAMYLPYRHGLRHIIRFMNGIPVYTILNMVKC